MKTTLVLLACAIFGAAVIAAPATSPAKEGKRAATQPTTAPSANKFYGTISAVNAEAKTFTIDEKVYAIVSESEMTKAADGSAATVESAKVGETARGTYTTSSDGTMKVTKVRFGKKAGGSNGGGGKKKKDAPATQAKSE